MNGKKLRAVGELESVNVYVQFMSTIADIYIFISIWHSNVYKKCKTRTFMFPPKICKGIEGGVILNFRFKIS